MAQKNEEQLQLLRTKSSDRFERAKNCRRELATHTCILKVTTLNAVSFCGKCELGKCRKRKPGSSTGEKNGVPTKTLPCPMKMLRRGRGSGNVK